jgi:hypothetical protein
MVGTERGRWNCKMLGAVLIKRLVILELKLIGELSRRDVAVSEWKAE